MIKIAIQCNLLERQVLLEDSEGGGGFKWNGDGGDVVSKGSNVGR